ncbi:MAG: SAM-dependent methyltransferase [Actinomycetota bacterium]
MADLVDPSLFDEDYLYFYDEILSAERSDAETHAILDLGGLQPGMAVLDAPCGHGRLANRLAARGLSVTGLDSSALFLDVARKDVAELGVSVEYVQGDLREIPWEGRFDAVVNWFTSFGYFDDDTNRAVLAGFRKALKPGGRLLLETINRERVIKLQAALPPGRPATFLAERGDDLMIDKVEFDPSTGCTVTERIIARGGKVRRVHFAVRTFTVPEIRDWVIGAGFTAFDALGSHGEPYALESERLVVVATA